MTGVCRESGAKRALVDLLGYHFLRPKRHGTISSAVEAFAELPFRRGRCLASRQRQSRLVVELWCRLLRANDATRRVFRFSTLER